MNSNRSELELHITNAETILSEIKEDINRMGLMKEKLHEIQSNRIYTETEVKEFEESYLYNKEHLTNITTEVYKHLNNAKKAWQVKQQHMSEMHKQGLLDVTVAKTWDKSLQEFAKRIEKADSALQFVHQDYRNN